MNVLLELQSLIVAVIIGTPLALALKIKTPLYHGFIIFLVYLILSKCLSYVDTQVGEIKSETEIMEEEEDDIKDIVKEQVVEERINNENSNVQVEEVSNEEKQNIMPDEPVQKAGDSLTDLEVSNSGPLDNLAPKELLSRLNYIHYATSHPYKPMNYQKYKSTSDIQLDEDRNTEGPIIATKSVKHLASANYFYPTLTEYQVNYDDCTNHDASSPLSCNQGPNNQNLFPQKSMLVAGLKNENDVKKVAREDFSVPAPVLQDSANKIKPLIENAPKNNKLCRHCKVGTCKHGICGSKL